MAAIPADEALRLYSTKGNLDGLLKILKKLPKGPGGIIDKTDDKGRNALHFASGFNNVECLEALLNHGAQRDLFDHKGFSSAHFAAGFGSPRTLKILLDRGTDVNLFNEVSSTSSSSCSFCSILSFFKCLFKLIIF